MKWSRGNYLYEELSYEVPIRSIIVASHFLYLKIIISPFWKQQHFARFLIHSRLAINVNSSFFPPRQNILISCALLKLSRESGGREFVSHSVSFEELMASWHPGMRARQPMFQPRSPGNWVPYWTKPNQFQSENFQAVPILSSSLKIPQEMSEQIRNMRISFRLTTEDERDQVSKIAFWVWFLDGWQQSSGEES